MIVTNEQGMQHLLASKFKLGADASAAAGPVGRDAGADTDWKMKAEVLTYLHPWRIRRNRSQRRRHYPGQG